MPLPAIVLSKLAGEVTSYKMFHAIGVARRVTLIYKHISPGIGDIPLSGMPDSEWVTRNAIK
ncbi:hypothetical protein J6590_073261 [Homalodisca vitripennis]|nr:hypothetical protein J6590_073261 [Homalodisca vitripennis]